MFVLPFDSKHIFVYSMPYLLKKIKIMFISKIILYNSHRIILINVYLFNATFVAANSVQGLYQIQKYMDQNRGCVLFCQHVSL